MRRALVLLCLIAGATVAHAQPTASPDTLLLRAARAGDIAALRAALDAGARPTATDTAHASALMLATVGGHLPAVTALLDAGADCRAPAFYRPGRTGFYGSLLAAAAAEGHLDLFKTLASRCNLHPDVQERDLTGATGWTPLQSAAANDRLDVVQHLIGVGARIQGVGEATPLDLAVQHGADRVAVWLMARGAPANRTPSDQLLTAAESGALGAVRHLLGAGAPLEALAQDRSTPFQRALGAGRIALAETLAARGADLRHIDGDGWTSLHYAAATDAGAAFIPRLLALGLAVDARASDGTTPLALALLKGALAPTRALVAAGATPSTVASDGWTALHIAARDAAPGLVDTLLAARVPVSPRTGDGYTPLVLAARNSNDMGIAQLVCAGASTDETGPDGLTIVQATPEGTAARTVAELAARSGCTGVRPYLALSRDLVRVGSPATPLDTAIVLLQRSDAAYTRLFGQDPTFVGSRAVIASALTQRGRADAALEILDAAFADTAAYTDAAVRTLLYHRALTLGALGRSREAIATQRQLLARERADAAVQPADRAMTEQALSKLLTEAGEMDEALGLARGVLVTMERELGPGDLNSHLAALSLAMAFFNTSNWTALDSLTAVWRPRAEASGDDVRSSWESIYGILAVRRGAYAEAEAHYRSALESRRRIFGPMSLETLRSLRDLIELYRVQQRFADGRPLVDETLVSAERLIASGQRDPFLIVLLRDVSRYLTGQNDLFAAEAAARRAIDLATTTVGVETLLAADAHQALADVQLRQNRLAEAGASYRQALAIYDARSDPDYLARLTSLGSLAEIERRSGRLDEAARLLDEVVPRLERAHPDDPSLPLLYNNRALVRGARGDRAGADADLQQALDRTRASETGDGSLVLLLVNSAARQMRSNPVQARRTAFEAARLAAEQIDTVLPALSIAEQQRFLENDLAVLTTVLVQLTRGRAAADTAYRYVSRYKGLLLRSLRQQARLARQPDLRADALALADARRALAAHVHARPAASADTATSGAWQRRLARLIERREAAERQLTRQGTGTLDDPLAGDRDVRSALREGEVFLDLYRVANAPENPDAPDHRYVAAIVAPGQPVRLRQIGRADTLDALVDRWRDAVRRGGDARAERQALDKRLWWPLVSTLPPGTRRLWLSPDGQLARLPFDVWAANPRRPLALAVVDSPRDLATLRTAPDPATATALTRPEGPLLLVGNVAFGGEGRPFAPLPGTATEIEAVRRLYRATHEARDQTVALTGTEASGHRVLDAMAGARYVHLATHGTFAATPPGDYAATRTVKPFSGPRRGNDATTTRLPLLESGLAFAGANTLGTASTDALSTQASFVTAEEFVGVDLSAARLVVLSACETGRGREITGQGVMGLRASFTTAGARTLLMSLWPVPDAATAQLMERFYDGLWRDGLAPGEALRRAQADVRAAFPAPVNWAAWVLAGETW